MSAEYSTHYDCMDNASSGWAEWLHDIEGGLVCGQGMTAAQAEEDAQRKLDARNTILRLSPRDRLLHLVTKQPGENCTNTMCKDDMGVAIRMIAKIILDDEQGG